MLSLSGATHDCILGKLVIPCWHGWLDRHRWVVCSFPCCFCCCFCWCCCSFCCCCSRSFRLIVVLLSNPEKYICYNVTNKVDIFWEIQWRSSGLVGWIGTDGRGLFLPPVIVVWTSGWQSPAYLRPVLVHWEIHNFFSAISWTNTIDIFRKIQQRNRFCLVSWKLALYCFMGGAEWDIKEKGHFLATLESLHYSLHQWVTRS